MFVRSPSYTLSSDYSFTTNPGLGWECVYAPQESIELGGAAWPTSGLLWF